MQITASASSLNVDDVVASANFVKKHFGFSEEMSAEGFVSLSRPDAGFNLIFCEATDLGKGYLTSCTSLFATVLSRP